MCSVLGVDEFRAVPHGRTGLSSRGLCTNVRRGPFFMFSLGMGPFFMFSLGMHFFSRAALFFPQNVDELFCRRRYVLAYTERSNVKTEW